MIYKISMAILLFLSLATPVFAQESEHFNARVTAVGIGIITVEDADSTSYEIEQDIVIAGNEDLKVGDSVIVERIPQPDGEERLLIVGRVRAPWIWVAVGLFLLVTWFVNGRHGIRSLINLIVLLAIILFVIIPLILRGWDPVFTTIVGGMIGMAWSLYFGYGRNAKSHVALASIMLTLVFVGILGALFVPLATLTGFGSEEASALISLGYTTLDMRGLLLAAIIIGALGVIDDLVVSQVSLIQELRKANANMSRKELFRAGIRVGRDHTGAMINTLVLAYAGAAFPLLILISLRAGPFESITGLFNNEVMATEIIRTLIGSIGLLLAMPITTWVAARYLSARTAPAHRRPGGTTP